jgi:hypothetical protein
MTEPFPSICVNWAVYDVPAIWAMVGPEREWVSREQTSAWLRTSEMLAAHQSNLQLLRDRVAQYWSPESSAASRPLLGQLDSLIDSTTHASEVARTNANALSLLTDALMEAKARVQPLQEAWATATTDTERARLNKQAWTVMSEADSRVIEHASLLEIPPDYRPPSMDDPGLPVSADPPGGTKPAAIPPLEERGTLEARTAPGATTGGAYNSSEAGAGGRSDPSPWSTSPILAGDGPPATQPADSGGLADHLDPSTSLSTPTRHAPTVDGVLAAPPSSSRAVGARAAVGETMGIERVPVGPLPADGIIGGKPGSMTARAGGPVQNVASEPVGSGLIGGGLGVGGLRSSGAPRRPYPADEEWEMPAGVEPVIKPDPAPDPKTAFDPGPNVIGLRR